jgi:outer membrane protein OmpA-like peptidoglycan-associated protein
MSNLKAFIFSQLILTLSFPIQAWAQNCDQATSLVNQAYYLGTFQARLKLQQALRLCPHHVKAHNNLGVLYEKAGNYNKALYHYRQILKYQPDYYLAWMGIGDVYYQLKKWPLSLEAYLQVCTRHPRARERITKLLHKNRYRTVEANEVMGHDSLSLLYDQQRLQRLAELTSACQRQYKSLATSDAPKAFSEQLVMYRNLRFKSGEYNLRLISDAQLDEIALALLNHQGNTVYIRGHADAQPWRGKTRAQSQRLNRRLSQYRADSIKKALTQRGISKNLISMGYGSSHPLVRGNNRAAWAKNRRVEIEITK